MGFPIFHVVARSGEMRYGDLEMFLFGLELGQFLELFKLHHVDFPLLLTLDEEDLTKVSVLY